MAGKLFLITGGSRSGKSEFAEQLVHSLGTSCAYIATAQVLDEEMKQRVAVHQKRRESDFWYNVEAPHDAHLAFDDLADVDSILFDCVTIYLTNFLYCEQNEDDTGTKIAKAKLQFEKLINAARKSGKNVVFVTNELGSGIVPANAMAREFRDVAGYINQFMAQNADKVYLVVCGIAVDLKELQVKIQTRSE